MKTTTHCELKCSVRYVTSTKLYSWADEVGIPVGEVIDLLVESYEADCNGREEREVHREMK